MVTWSDSDDDADDAEWYEYHQRCCKADHSDGWSHGFHWAHHFESEKKIGAIDNGDSKPQAKGGNAVACHFVHEPQPLVVKHFTIDNWSKMGDSISCNAVLKYVDLSHCGLTVECIMALFGGGRNYDHCPLEKLNLGQNQLGTRGVAALIPFLKSRSKLKYLNLNNTNLDSEGARLLSEALQHMCIEFLHVRDNTIGDEGVEHLLSAENSSRFMELCLIENVIGQRGYEAICRFFRRSGTDLKKILFNCADGESAKMIVDSISSNSKLQDLHLYSGDVRHGDQTMVMAVPNLQNLVCNTSSLESLCHSNHQMKWLGMTTDGILRSYPTVRKALDINARSLYGASKVKVVRCKLRTFYFKGEFNVHTFAKMDVKLFPNVLELVTKTEICVEKADGFLNFGKGTYNEVSSQNIDGIYRLVRNCHLPGLYSFASPGAKTKTHDIQTNYQITEPELESAQWITERASTAEKSGQLLIGKSELRTENSALPTKRPKIQE